MVTTPGRLVHHLRDTDGLDLSKLRFLVVDEADRVMDSAQSDWLYHLEKHIAKNSHDAPSSNACIFYAYPELTHDPIFRESSWTGATAVHSHI